MVGWSKGEVSTEPSPICVSYDFEPYFVMAGNSANALTKGTSSLY